MNDWLYSYILFDCMHTFSVGLLPCEFRKLMKWRMSPITPNVVKQALQRSNFKITKSKLQLCNKFFHFQFFSSSTTGDN